MLFLTGYIGHLSSRNSGEKCGENLSYRRNAAGMALFACGYGPGRLRPGALYWGPGVLLICTNNGKTTSQRRTHRQLGGKAKSHLARIPQLMSKWKRACIAADPLFAVRNGSPLPWRRHCAPHGTSLWSSRGNPWEDSRAFPCVASIQRTRTGSRRRHRPAPGGTPGVNRRR